MKQETKEAVLQHFLELNDEDRWQVLDRIAGDEDGDPIGMFVEANLVMSEEEFREAKRRLTERGYSVDFVSV